MIRRDESLRHLDRIQRSRVESVEYTRGRWSFSHCCLPICAGWSSSLNTLKFRSDLSLVSTVPMSLGSKYSSPGTSRRTSDHLIQGSARAVTHRSMSLTMDVLSRRLPKPPKGGRQDRGPA